VHSALPVSSQSGSKSFGSLFDRLSHNYYPFFVPICRQPPIGKGKHDLEAITIESGVSSTARASNVLGVLEEVRLIERRIRATIKPDDQTQARYARYHLADPFLQFYYRFVDPNRSQIALELYGEIEPIFREQLRGFVGYAFEALCRQWMVIQARNSLLPFSPEFIGSDWGAGYQADVVAIHWKKRQVLIGEAKWAEDDMDHRQWRDFVQSFEGVMNRLKQIDAQSESSARRRAMNRGDTYTAKPSPPWTRHLIVFVRRGVSGVVRADAKGLGARIVTFAEIVKDLERLPEKRLR
jgi:AAA+ ATPase superfamily predicted ATPase